MSWKEYQSFVNPIISSIFLIRLFLDTYRLCINKSNIVAESFHCNASVLRIASSHIIQHWSYV